jgi:hypothetical protein
MKTIQYSSHGLVRMQQRGITARMVGIAVRCGERSWSHSMVCYRITDRSLRNTPYASEVDQLRGVCVVMADGKHVVTVKWDYRMRRPGLMRRARLVERLSNYPKNPLPSGVL